VGREGTVGLKKVVDKDKAGAMKHIWSLFSYTGSLWVAWVQECPLKGKCFCTPTLKLREETGNFLAS